MRRRHHLVLAPFAVLLALCCVPTARAEQGLTFRAPAGCPSQAAARERLGALGVETRDTLHVQIGPAAGGGLRATIDDGSGSARVLEARDCDALSDAVLLVVAMSFAEPAAPPAPGIAKPGFALGVGGLARVDVATLPDPTLGLGGVAALLKGPLRVELEAAYDFPQSSSRRAAHGGGQFGLWSTALRGCYALLSHWQAHAPVALGPCLAAEFGVMRGRAFEATSARTRRALWSALWFGVTASLRVGSWLRPWLSLELGLPVRRPSFDVAGHGAVYQAGRVVGRGTIGLLVQFE